MLVSNVRDHPRRLPRISYRARHYAVNLDLKQDMRAALPKKPCFRSVAELKMTFAKDVQ